MWNINDCNVFLLSSPTYMSTHWSLHWTVTLWREPQKLWQVYSAPNTHQFKCSWFVYIRECVRGVEPNHLDFLQLNWLACFSHSISSFKNDPVSCSRQKGRQKIAQESPIDSTSGYPQVAGPQWTSFQVLGSLGGSSCLFVLCLYYSSVSDNTDISLIM